MSRAKAVAKLIHGHRDAITVEWERRTAKLEKRAELTAHAHAVLEVLENPAPKPEPSPIDELAKSMSLLRETLRSIAAKHVPAAQMARAIDRAIDRAAYRRIAGSFAQVEERAIASRNAVMALVSHDLRNPLNAIAISGELMSLLVPHQEPATRMRKAIEVILRSTEQMNSLIADLTDFAAIETGKLKTSFGPCDARAIVKNTVELFDAAAAQKNVRIAIDLGEDIVDDANDVSFHCDRVRIVQVLGNLLANALAMTPEQGTIRVAVEPTGEHVRFCVSDSGPGIPHDVRPKVFDAYWRGRDVAYAGRGLGLAIAKGLIEAHGGRIWIEDSKEGGVAFVFDVPKATDGA